MPKNEKYEVMGIVDRIAASSRASVKVGDSYYTVEYHEERTIPETYMMEIDIEEERKALWDTCNAECDRQIEDILKTFKK